MRVFAVIALLAGCITYGFVHAEVSGIGNRSTSYQGSLQLGSESHGECRFTVTLDPVLFQLHTLLGKYRVVRINVANTSDKLVVLSHNADHVKVSLGKGRDVAAIIDMQQADPGVWDQLSSSARKALAYPKSIPAGDEVAVGRLSQMSFFIFLPAEVATLPASFELVIDSMHKSVSIAPPPATAA